MVRLSIILSADEAAGLKSRYPTQAVCSSFFCSSMLGRMCSGFIMTIWVMSHSTRSYVRKESQWLLHKGGCSGKRTFLMRSKSANLAAISSSPKGFFLCGSLAENCLRVYSSKRACLAKVSSHFRVDGLHGVEGVRQAAVR